MSEIFDRPFPEPKTDTCLGTYDFDIPDSADTIIVKPKVCRLILGEKGFEYHVSRDAKVAEDEDLLKWELVCHNWRCAVRRRDLSAVNLFFDKKHQYWVLEIEARGLSYSITIQYTQHAQAMPMYEILKRYHFETP